MARDLRSSVLGALLWIAAFAFATGIFFSVTLLLGALPPVATFYERAGGARGAVQGWNAARGLIPFRFTREALTRLEDLAGGFAVGTEEA